MRLRRTLSLNRDTIEPEFDVSESDMPTLGDVKVGQQLRIIINYKTLEKTKSFTIVKINFAHLLNSKRKL